MGRKFSITGEGLDFHNSFFLGPRDWWEPHNSILDLFGSKERRFHHEWVIVEVMKEKGFTEKETLEALTWLWRREFISDERD